MPNKKSLEEKQVELQIQQAKNLGIILDRVVPAVEKYYSEKMKRLEEPRFKWTLVAFAIILVVIVGVSAYLLYLDKIPAENFTFLLGILVGAIMALLGDIILEAQQ